MHQQLVALRRRLVEAQSTLIHQASLAGVVPPDNVIRKISDLENCILAIETMIEDAKTVKPVQPLTRSAQV